MCSNPKNHQNAMVGSLIKTFNPQLSCILHQSCWVFFLSISQISKCTGLCYFILCKILQISLEVGFCKCYSNFTVVLVPTIYSRFSTVQLWLTVNEPKYQAVFSTTEDCVTWKTWTLYKFLLVCLFWHNLFSCRCQIANLLPRSPWRL